MTKAERMDTPVPNDRLEGLRRGDRVVVRDALDQKHARIALSGPVWGWDFPVVWVVSDDEITAGSKPHEGESVPWPVEDVWPR